MKSSKFPSPTPPNRQTTIDVDVARVVRNLLFGIAAIIAAAKSPETARVIAEASTDSPAEQREVRRPP